MRLPPTAIMSESKKSSAPPEVRQLLNIMERRWRACQDDEQDPVSTVSSSYGNSFRREQIPYGPSEFERDVQQLLGFLAPFSALPGIQVFDPRERGFGDFGAEIDHVLHIQTGISDVLVLIEVKRQPIRHEGDEWIVTYNRPDSDKITKKCCKSQINRQIKILTEHLKPLTPNTNLEVVGLVVSIDPNTKQEMARGFDDSRLALLPVKKLIEHLSDRFNLSGEEEDRQKGIVLRVSQSPLLSLLRMSLPLPDLGHPELKSAISYVERCRRSLDERIYSDFEPTPSHWAINGSAGMGKSVLLAYAAAVFCSGYRFHEYATGEAYTGPATDIFEKTGFDEDKKLSIGILAMSEKQLSNLKIWFQFFVTSFQEKDEVGQIRFRRPSFVLVRTLDELKNKKWSALFVDECHDITPAAERAMVESHKKNGFYLVVACDRHQKLALVNSKARILDGLDFGLKTKRLKQNYRNPTPINIASLALMFRWSASEGPKMIPTKKELREQFGFSVKGMLDAEVHLSIQSDAHPASAWSHTVGSFPNAYAAFQHLSQASLESKDVLWARFSEEDPDFDYESLASRFVYHNCRNHDAHKISDKYIKGQDYPIVVIEGFPGFMDRYDSPEAEQKMWSFRRELYLCASRATCFLYFVCNTTQTEEITRIQGELEQLTKQLGTPVNFGKGGTKLWQITVASTGVSRPLEHFKDSLSEEGSGASSEDDDESPEESTITHDSSHGGARPPESVPEQGTQETKKPEVPEDTEDAWELWVDGPLTVHDFAQQVAKKPYEILADLIKLKVYLNSNQFIEVEYLKKLTADYGGTLHQYEDEPEVDEEVENAVSTTATETKQTTGPKKLDEHSTKKGEKVDPEPITPKDKKQDLMSSATLTLQASKPSGKESESRTDRPKTFRISANAIIQDGTWIQHGDDLAKVIEVNTKPNFSDCHRIWFAKDNTIFENHSLRGRVKRIIAEIHVPEEIRKSAPSDPS